MTNKFVLAIRKSGLSIYDEIPANSRLRIPTEEVEKLLKRQLQGEDISGLAIRTRSRIVKEKVCLALGYSIPAAFRRTQPRFPGQDLDIYVQKARNLQVWNEGVIPSRRYALVILDQESRIWDVKVITGELLASLDKTGTLTSKFQAILKPNNNVGLLTSQDTSKIASQVRSTTRKSKVLSSPLSQPSRKELLSIKEIHNRLRTLEGKTLEYSGAIQERRKRSKLHEAVCNALGYDDYLDNGQFPDLVAQLLEVKLQTSQTIDLGLSLPTDRTPIAGLNFEGVEVSPSDVRYALFSAERVGAYEAYRINRVYLVTGEDFFHHFELMKEKERNQKLQIPLPKEFFPQSSTP